MSEDARADPNSVGQYLSEIEGDLLTKEEEKALGITLAGKYNEGLEFAIKHLEKIEKKQESLASSIRLLPEHYMKRLCVNYQEIQEKLNYVRSCLEILRKVYGDNKRNCENLEESVAEYHSVLEKLGEKDGDVTKAKNEHKKAREEFIKKNLRLVVSIAKTFQGRGLSLPDLIGKGNVGLIEGVEGYNPRLGYKFSTYTSWWIKREIRKAIADDARTVRIPGGVLDDLSKIHNFTQNFSMEHEREPTIKEIAKKTGLKIKRIKDLEKTSIAYNSSLDAELVREGDETFGYFLEDKEPEQPRDATEKQLLKKRIDWALDCLDERDQDIIKRIYGLDGYKKHTLGEVGAIFHISKQRVKQREKKAIEKLQHPVRLSKLKPFL